MKISIRHIALYVPDLRDAEEYYQPLFSMELIGREAELEDGNWYSLPPDKSWNEAENARIQLSMTALRKGDIVLALFEGQVQPGQVFAIGLTLPIEEIAGIWERLSDDTEVAKDEPGSWYSSILIKSSGKSRYLVTNSKQRGISLVAGLTCSR